MYSSLSLLALGLASSVAAQQPGTIVEKGDSLVSAMMVSSLDAHPSRYSSPSMTMTDVPC